jgi:hypothetical protein
MSAKCQKRTIKSRYERVHLPAMHVMELCSPRDLLLATLQPKLLCPLCSLGDSQSPPIGLE